MATIEPMVDSTKRNRVAMVVLGALATIVAVAMYFGLRPPPQMGTSEEVFNTVDALFTAVTSHDERRLGECEKRLQGYREVGKLPPDAADALDAIIHKARSGAWQAAAERLYDFMKAQRRDGYAAPPSSRKTKTRPTAQRS
jgi:hypothetical protein